ncbi:hypothetical protein KKA14_16310 [bacterium]|nr:hypothetical protein [bacterium]
MRKKIFFVIYMCFFLIIAKSAVSDTSETLTKDNEFGGVTVEVSKDDFSRLIIFYDADSNKVKEETIYTSEYPVDNGLKKIVTHFFFGKKIKEERFFKAQDSRRTLINKIIDYYDRNTDLIIKSENYFIAPYTGYNVIYQEKGKKNRIEWYYPENTDGISKNIVYIDDNGVAVKTESFYTEKTMREKGYYKRIYFQAYNDNMYIRMTRQEWYYSDEFAAQNDGKYTKIENYHYWQGKLIKTETGFFDKNGRHIAK